MSLSCVVTSVSPQGPWSRDGDPSVIPLCVPGSTSVPGTCLEPYEDLVRINEMR